MPLLATGLNSGHRLVKQRKEEREKVAPEELQVEGTRKGV
jgi:hypothetical protein